MNLSTSSNRIIIDGNIKTVGDFQSIKNSVDSVIVNNKNIVVDIKNSLSLTSAVIGYFNKLILKDNISIQVNVGDKQLYELLDDLNLTSVFNLKKV
ncbi:MAG: hypothetical protein NTW78_00100 [Campylobacterales bacterium]|nr:hypothetical protein [Campylobacterales bacterium]